MLQIYQQLPVVFLVAVTRSLMSKRSGRDTMYATDPLVVRVLRYIRVDDHRVGLTARNASPLKQQQQRSSNNNKRRGRHLVGISMAAPRCGKLE